MKTRLQQTTSYSQFCFAQENRDVDVTHLRPEHKRLRESMRRYGFLPSCPITVRAVNGRFEILEGQHRFTFARELRLPIWYVIVDVDIDIAEINQTQATWRIIDYARRWAKDGRADYIEALDFAKTYGVSVGYAFAILAGTIIFHNISAKFRAGAYRITSRDYAKRIGESFKDICDAANPSAKRALFESLVACMAVPYFDEARLITTLRAQPDLLAPANTRDGYLKSFEDVYNFRRHSREPLAFDASEAMRARGDMKIIAQRKKAKRISRKAQSASKRRMAA